MLEAVRQDNLNLHSVVVIRHGVLVLEAYNYPFNAQTRHAVYSVTKSIISILVGIASAQGLLAVDTPLISFFPSVKLDDERKGSIRVEHLLSMSSGIEWMEPLYSGLNDHLGILEADNPAHYFFTPALLAEPGTVFNYNSGGSHLLSMLVQSASGQPAAEFAAKQLFAPLDIRDFSWKSDATGHSQGGTGLELLPVDMAKIGQLMLDNGKWQATQILPTVWVKTATQAHVRSSPKMGYGYQWWVSPQGDYYALGWGGQQIHVFPEEDMVVVFNAGASGTEVLHNELINTYLLPAVVSKDASPVVEQAQVRLNNAIQGLASPRVQVSAPLSPMASEVDGRQWLVTGRGNWSMFSLHFLSDIEARLDLELDKEMMPLLVGLDGIYRITDTAEYGPIALLGYWESTDTFVLVQQNLREADKRITRLKFTEAAVKLFSEWFVEPYKEESEAVIFGE
ncbi:MAG: serine hydrolase [Chloroflexi bacterium]|nr:serine hydrolase [Chloroflexota bacterium]